MAKCEHLEEANRKIKPGSKVCRECAAAGLNSVELRVCLICGNVACCDSSTGRHATRHFQETGHSVMGPYKGGKWIWCYVHQSYM